MARARAIPDLQASGSFAQGAARVVGVRAEEVFEHAANVLDLDDIERVHDMRVATRRLRAVLEIFAPCFPKKPHRAVLRDVKRLADALGERRDPDVQADALEGYARAVPAALRTGPRELIAELHAERAGANERLAETLAWVESSDLRGRLQALAGSAAEASA